MKVVAIMVGAVVALGGAGYAGACYMVGSTFVETYQDKLGSTGQSAQIDQGIFSSKVTSTVVIPGQPGGLEVVTEVDHMIMPDRWLTANTSMNLDQQSAQMATMFFANPPQINITTIAYTDDTKSIEGRLDAISSKKNPMLEIKVGKPVTFEVSLNANNVPTKTSLRVPDARFSMQGAGAELKGLHFTTDYVQNGTRTAINNSLKFKVLKQDMAGASNRFGPLDLRLNISGLSAEEAAKLGTQGAMGLYSLRNRPDVTIAIPKSSMKTSFGMFAIDGKVKTLKGPGKMNGEFDLQIPVTPKAKKMLGPKFAAIMKEMVKRKLFKRTRGQARTKLVIAGDKITLNGQSLEKHAKALANLKNQDIPKGRLKPAKKGKIRPNALTKKQKGQNKKFKALPKTKTAH